MSKGRKKHRLEDLGDAVQMARQELLSANGLPPVVGDFNTKEEEEEVEERVNKLEEKLTEKTEEMKAFSVSAFDSLTKSMDRLTDMVASLGSETKATANEAKATADEAKATADEAKATAEATKKEFETLGLTPKEWTWTDWLLYGAKTGGKILLIAATAAAISEAGKAGYNKFIKKEPEPAPAQNPAS